MLLGIGARKNGIVTIKPGQAVAAAFRATAAFTSALKARASTFSPSWMSIALRVLPSRLELKRRDGSGRLAPWAKVSFTAFLYDSPVQTIPWCDQTGTPAIAFDGFRHFRSSVIPGSASRISARTRARVCSRQSPGPPARTGPAFGGDPGRAADLRGLLARDVPLAPGVA